MSATQRPGYVWPHYGIGVKPHIIPIDDFDDNKFSLLIVYSILCIGIGTQLESRALPQHLDYLDHN